VSHIENREEQNSVNDDKKTEERGQAFSAEDGLGRTDNVVAVDELEEKQKNRADVSSDSESDTEMFEYVVEHHIGGNPDTSKHSQKVKDSREERSVEQQRNREAEEEIESRYCDTHSVHLDRKSKDGDAETDVVIEPVEEIEVECSDINSTHTVESVCEKDSRIDEDSVVEERDGLDEVRDEVAHIVDQPVNTDSGVVTAEIDEEDETKKDTEKEQEEEKLTVVSKPKPRRLRNSSELGDVPPIPSGRQPPVPPRRSGRDRKTPDRLGDYVM